MGEGMTGERAIELIFRELQKAEIKHPSWPDDVIHAVGIITEEVGESMQEAIDWVYSDKKNMDRLITELAQTGAMALRALIHLTETAPDSTPKTGP